MGTPAGTAGETNEASKPESAGATEHFGRIAAVYLLGLLLGGIYVGIIAPLRTVVQADLGIDSDIGIWMINIYTLFYAATIPISGKLAEARGRSRVFALCLSLFTIGALICGLSQFTGAFGMLLVGRVIQAAGAGGVIPVATAAMGASAPEGKRGMWLGVASAVAGVANVLGAAVGSLISSIVGVGGWCWAFFVAVPIGVLLVVAALLWLPREQAASGEPLDVLGSLIFVCTILLLLFGLKGLTFEDPLASLVQPTTLAPILLAIVGFVAFRFAERRAADPVFHMEYLHNGRIVIIMAISFFIGCCIISMTLVPEFAEYVLGASVGSGGYYMAIIGIFAIVGPPVCGKLIDRHGAKPILAGGLVVTALGFLFLALVVAPAAEPSALLMLVGLAIVGLGMGFTMGTPLNYMILQNTTPEQSTSAIATIALVRQMGTTIAPALLVGFTTAGWGLDGYVYMMIAVAVFNLISLALLMPYRE